MTDKRLNLWTSLTRMTLQEPTYKDVCIVYRVAQPEEPRVVSVRRAKAWKGAEQDMVEELPNVRNVHVKHFRDVPMADLELLFPDKHVYMSIADRLKFGLMSVVGVSVMAPVLMDGSTFVASPAWVAGLIASSSYLVRVLSRMYATWAYHSSLTTAFVSDNIVSSGTSCLLWMGFDAKDQLVKEAAVVYMALVELHLARDCSTTPAAVSVDRVAATALDMLRSTYAFDIHHFDPMPALSALSELGLVAMAADPSDKDPNALSVVLHESSL